MIQFNIIGKGFLEMDDSGLSFKQSNSFWRFAEVSLGRSVEFSVHGSRHNRALLEYGDDADEFGTMLRATYPCQMIAGMTAVFGTISVTAYDGDEFKCCFYIGNTDKLEALKNRSLSDIAIDSDPIAWATSTPVGTETSDGLIALLDYEYPVPVTAWQRLPSVNAKLYAEAVLSQIGIACNGIDSDVWLVAGSINGGGEDAVTLTQNALNDATVMQTQSYFNVVDIDLKMVEMSNFGVPITQYTYSAKGFKATQNLELTFPDPMPNNVYLIKWDNRPKRYTTIGGKPLRYWYEFHTLDGRTISLTKGDIVFFATVPAPDYRGSLNYRGFWGDEYAVVSVAVNVKRTTELSLGENWYLQNNAPQMTVWEFLRSVALAIGKEIVVTVNPNNIDDVAVNFVDSDYGVNYIRPADEVINTELVKRRVDAWGDETANAVIEFDSEDYVTERLRTVYDVQTTQVKGEASHVAKFSEGNAGATMVYIKDNDDGKFSSKKWTIARRVGDELHRIEAPFPFGYDDIAVASTCVTMKVAATIEDFLSLQPPTTFLWRGLAYIWTDANWSGNVMSLTLQKVSQPAAVIPALPYDAEVEYLESTGTQYINTLTAMQEDDAIEVEASFVIQSGYNILFYGSLPMTGGYGVEFYYQGNNWYYFRFGGSLSNRGYTALDYQAGWHVYKLDRHYLYMDGVAMSIPPAIINMTTNPLILFGSNSQPGHVKIRSAKILRGGTPILDLIPVRVGSVGYMYDRVSGTLFGNDGTGDFVVGPDV